MKTIVLAGGYATRMWPITKNRPKMLLLLGERMVIGHLFEKLEADDRIDDVYVSTNRRFASEFERFIATSEFSRPQLSVEETASEGEKLGVVGALVQLVDENGLVHRYEGRDGLPGEEGAFLLCSFWLVDALALSGRTDEAVEVFEDVVEYANPLGLFSEEVAPSTGAHLGNTPQAFSHIGLINSALYLESVLGEEPPEPLPGGSEISNGIQ